MMTPTPSKDFDPMLRHARHCSHYLNRLIDAEPELELWLKENHQTVCDAGFIQRFLDESTIEDEAQLFSALRILRKRVMSLLIVRDLNGLCDLTEVMRAATALAESTVRRAQSFTMQALLAQFGQPIGADSGEVQELLVIGMGKLGGFELNVSSDIDLIFAYPEDGETNGARTLSNHEFFIRLGRKIIALINDLTADG